MITSKQASTKTREAGLGREPGSRLGGVRLRVARAARLGEEVADDRPITGQTTTIADWLGAPNGWVRQRWLEDCGPVRCVGGVPQDGGAGLGVGDRLAQDGGSGGRLGRPGGDDRQGDPRGGDGQYQAGATALTLHVNILLGGKPAGVQALKASAGRANDY